MFLSLRILNWKSAAESECPAIRMCRVIQKPHSVSCCAIHAFAVSFVKVADVCASGALGSGQSICPARRCSVFFAG